jgi:hypothetical protein
MWGHRGASGKVSRQSFGFRKLADVRDLVQSAIAITFLLSLLCIGGCALTSGADDNLLSTRALTINTSSLPQGQLKSAYEADLSASGGKEPYTWSVTSGTLPEGLSLTGSSGTISGMPSQSGDATFTIGVKDSSSPITTAQASMTIHIASALEIATENLPAGTVKASYTANLSADGGTAPYTWSVVSGKLPSGLKLNGSGGIAGTPTESGQTSFVVQVTDSSSPAESAKVGLAISIANNTASKLEIVNGALPSGVVQITYTASLAASGGTAPYTWSIVSGQLPTALTLSASGVINGVPTTAGQASFVAKVSDSSSPNPQTATQSLAITISQPGASAGPYASRTDLGFIPLPVPLPNIGNETGAGKCITQPYYNNLVCRATDINTLGNARFADQQEFSTCCGGWADINGWNTNSTMFFVETNGSGLVAMSFNPATQTAAPLYGTVIPSVHGGWWSYSNPQLAYSLGSESDPVVVSLTFNSQTVPPNPVVIADLATAPNCVPALKGVTQWEELAVSHDEQTFVVAAGTGDQDTADYLIVYNLAKGCRWYNTKTRQIGGNWGPTGPATTPDSFLLHSARISGDGQTAFLGATTGIRYFFQIDSLNVTSTPLDNSANGGHFALGYTGYANTTGHAADGSWCKEGEAYRTFGDVLNPTYLIPSASFCGDTELPGDDHPSWNNDNSSDNQPIFTATVTNPLGTPITTAWQNEIMAFSVSNPGTVWRFFSTYITGTSPFFTCQNGIGTVSQDGKWFVFTSDWGNTLGLDMSGSNRCDVFIGKLR